METTKQIALTFTYALALVFAWEGFMEWTIIATLLHILAIAVVFE